MTPTDIAARFREESRYMELLLDTLDSRFRVFRSDFNWILVSLSEMGMIESSANHFQISGEPLNLAELRALKEALQAIDGDIRSRYEYLASTILADATTASEYRAFKVYCSGQAGMFGSYERALAERGAAGPNELCEPDEDLSEPPEPPEYSESDISADAEWWEH